MKQYIPFLLLSLILLCANFTAKAQSEDFEVERETKVIPAETYGMLVEDAVQRRVLDTLVTELTQQLSDSEQVQQQIERNLTRQITILSVENQALEIQTAAWENKYDVVEKQLGKKENGNKLLKGGIFLAFLVGLLAGG